MEQKALAIVHVGINFEFPSVRAECSTDAGGEGRLRLTEPAASTAPETDEEAGIEIELRPVGKRVSKLSLLSGGEKSLGAICFLFSLFLAHPCPFYLLDEVEAALDDVNLGRLIGLLEELFL